MDDEEGAELIRWMELREVSAAEAAAILDCPVKTVRSRHRRAMEAFSAVGRRLIRFGLGGGR